MSQGKALQLFSIEHCIVKTLWMSTGALRWEWIYLSKTSNLKVIKVVFVRCNKQPLLGLPSIRLCCCEDDVFLGHELFWNISEASRVKKKKTNKDKIITGDTINSDASAQYKLLQPAKEKLHRGYRNRS